MLTKIKSLFKTKAKQQTIELFKIAGHEFRVLDPKTMSNVRKTRFFFEEYSREWGMTKQDILDFDGIILKETQAPASKTIHDQNAELLNKLARINTLISIRSAMIQEDYQYKPFLRSACAIVLMDDESENDISNEVEAEKLKLCSQYPELEAFFLRVCRTFQLSTTDSQDISKIWEWYPSTQQKVMENKVLKEINTTIYQSGT